MLSRNPHPFVLSDLSATGEARALIHCQVDRSDRETVQSYNEAWLQGLIAAHPEILPVNSIEPALSGAVTICTEMRTPAGYVDVLLATSRGDLIIVECKLWRNPQARREVVGQIIDYAKDLSRWKFEDLEGAIKRAKAPSGVAADSGLYARCATSDGLDEPSFVDAVSRNLRRGRFLLLITGDGIQESVEAITEFLQGHAGLHFTLALVEMLVFQVPDSETHVVLPRLLARTQMIERGVVNWTDDRIEIRPPSDTRSRDSVGSSIRPPRRVAATISEELFFERLDAREPGCAESFRAFVESVAPLGVTIEFMTASAKLLGHAQDDLWPLGTVQASDGTVWFESVVGSAKAAGRGEAGFQYYRRLAALIDDPKLRQSKQFPNTKTGTASLYVGVLLGRPDFWRDAIEDYLGELSSV